MAALPYIQLYVADYLSDTMHLSTDEHGAYLLLIMNYWQTGKPIQKKRIQAITRLDKERITAVTEVLSEFFNETNDGLWVHLRIEADLSKVHDKSTQASNAGKKSAQKRWGNRKNITGVITGVKIPLQRNDNHTDTDTDTDTDIKKHSAKKANAFVLPDWINKNHWDVWHETPKRKKASDSQKQIAVNKLLSWKESGIDYAQALENAAMGGYQGLFEPKTNKYQAPTNRTEFQQSTTNDAYEKLFGSNNSEKEVKSEAAGV